MIDYKSILLSDYGYSIHLDRYFKILSHYQSLDVLNHYERHHILPQSLYPQYKKHSDNILRLPYRVHYIVHYLLYRITTSFEMYQAFELMNRQAGKHSSRLYDQVKRLYIENGVLAPKAKYWNGDKRVADKSLSTGRYSGYQKGLSRLNDPKYGCYLNLITKSYVQRLSNHSYDHHILFCGRNLNKIYVFNFYGMYFVSTKLLPPFLKDRIRYINNEEYLLNTRFNIIRKSWHNVYKNFIHILYQCYGKDVRLKDINFTFQSFTNYTYSENHLFAKCEDNVIIHIENVTKTLIKEFNLNVPTRSDS